MGTSKRYGEQGRQASATYRPCKDGPTTPLAAGTLDKEDTADTMARINYKATRQTETEKGKTGVLSSVSFTTVIASALAAGTSLVLSSKIGLAGSVIGTVVAAAVSSLALQIYQSLLSKTAEKVGDVANLTGVGTPTDTTRAANGEVGNVTHDGATELLHRPATLSDETSVLGVAESGTPIAPDSIRNAARARETRYNARRALVISIIAALVALAVTAGIITVATAGHGLGSTTTFAPVAVETTDADATDQQPAQPTQTDNADATNPDDQSDASDTTTDGTTTDGGTTDNGATDNSTANGGTSGNDTANNGASSDSGTGTDSDSSSSSDGSSNGTDNGTATDGNASSGDTSSGTATGTTSGQ